MQQVYLDYNATTPLLPAAREAWLRVQDEAWGNASSTHAMGQRARFELDRARASLAAALGSKGHEWVLCGSGSEANALAIRSAMTAAPTGATRVCCSAIEHSSVLRNAEASAPSTLELVAVDADGRIDHEAFAASLDERVALCCVQLANNELGTIQDIPAIVECLRARAPAAWLHLDACQGVGKMAVDVRALGVDSASIAGHKFGAPKGIGALYLRNGRQADALIHGGRQQQGRRSGTEDVAGAAALAAALSASLAGLETRTQHQRAVLDACFARIAAALPAVRWLARDVERLAGTMNLAFPGIVNTALITRLDHAGYAVSPGSACMAARGEASHVLRALGIAPELATGAVRVSIGAHTSDEDLAGFAEAYISEVQAMTETAG